MEKGERYLDLVNKVKRKFEGRTTRACIGCGYCCRKAPCHLGEIGDEGWCFWLDWDGVRWRCGLLGCDELEGERKSIRYELAVGGGCTSPLNDWRARCIVPDPRWIRINGESSHGWTSEGGASGQ